VDLAGPGPNCFAAFARQYSSHEIRCCPPTRALVVTRTRRATVELKPSKKDSCCSSRNYKRQYYLAYTLCSNCSSERKV